MGQRTEEISAVLQDENTAPTEYVCLYLLLVILISAIDVKIVNHLLYYNFLLVDSVYQI